MKVIEEQGGHGGGHGGGYGGGHGGGVEEVKPNYFFN